jgi:hypothetical protein
VGQEAFAVSVLDVNRDRRPDIVALTPVAITVLLGNDATFRLAPGEPIAVGRGAYHLVVADFDEDGIADLAASDFEGDSVAVLLGR